MRIFQTRASQYFLFLEVLISQCISSMLITNVLQYLPCLRRHHGHLHQDIGYNGTGYHTSPTARKFYSQIVAKCCQYNNIYFAKGQVHQKRKSPSKQCCYHYRSYDFYHDISELSYGIFITIFPVRAERYICAAPVLCKHDQVTISLLKFQHDSIRCREQCDACYCRPATMAEQRLSP